MLFVALEINLFLKQQIALAGVLSVESLLQGIELLRPVSFTTRLLTLMNALNETRRRF